MAYTISDLKPGMSESFSKTVSERDIQLFGEVSGDTNPVHFDDDFAKKTIFKGRIAHGMLTAGLVSAVLGTKLPGAGCIYISQSLKFLAPAKAGDTVTARVTVKEMIADKLHDLS